MEYALFDMQAFEFLLGKEGHTSTVEQIENTGNRVILVPLCRIRLKIVSFVEGTTWNCAQPSHDRAAEYERCQTFNVTMMRSPWLQLQIFRYVARESLARAKVELGADDPHRLRYAALELRDAMEALTYDRALAFKDDVPPEEYKTWQPRKLMAVLLEIDPSIGMTSSIAFGLEEEYGKPAPRENMKLLGTDVVFTLANLKAHYDAIGSYLHMPSLEQVQSGQVPDPAKLRERCHVVIGLVEKVLNSQVWNSTLGVVAVLDQCMNEECKRPIRKRMPSGREKVDAQCFECKAEYTITSETDGRVLWMPKMTDAPCSTPQCPERMSLWPHEVRSGTHWRCRGCGTHNGIALTVTKVEDADNATPS